MARRRYGRYDSYTINCGSGDFAEVIHDYMEEHCYEVNDDVVQATGEAGNKAAQLLRERSRMSRGRGGGAYAKDWTADMKASETGAEVVIHNRHHYQLTHLLEKDHVIRNRKGGPTYGTVRGDGIIAEVADKVDGNLSVRFQG